MTGHKVTMLGTGLIGLFYTLTLHGQRNRDRVHVVYSRSEDRARKRSPARTGSGPWATDLEEAVAHPETDTVVIGLPNHLHEEAVEVGGAPGRRCSARSRSDGMRTKRGGCSKRSSAPESLTAISRTSSTRRRRCGRSRPVPAGPSAR